MAKAPQTDEQKAAAAQAAADKKAADAKAAADKKAEADAAASSNGAKTYKVQLSPSFPSDVRHQGPVPGDFWVRAEERELELNDEQLKGYHNDQYFTINGKATDAAKRITGEQSRPAERQSVEDAVNQNRQNAADAAAEADKARGETVAQGSHLSEQEEIDRQRELNARLKPGAVDAPTSPTATDGVGSSTDSKTGQVAPRSADTVNGPADPADNIDEDADAPESDEERGIVHPELQTGTDGQEDGGDGSSSDEDDKPAPTVKELKKNNNRDTLIAKAKELGYEATDEDTKDTLAQKIVELKG